MKTARKSGVKVTIDLFCTSDLTVTKKKKRKKLLEILQKLLFDVGLSLSLSF